MLHDNPVETHLFCHVKNHWAPEIFLFEASSAYTLASCSGQDLNETGCNYGQLG